MDAFELVARLRADAEAGRPLDHRAVREEIHEIAERTTASDQRVILLDLHKAVMDAVERSGDIAPEKMDAFRHVRGQDYNLLLSREFIIGGTVSVELAYAVTEREVKAGRMGEDDPLHLMAVEAISKPHLSVAELIERERQAELIASEPKHVLARAFGWLRRK